jgi:hypothetical protein
MVSTINKNRELIREFRDGMITAIRNNTNIQNDLYIITFNLESEVIDRVTKIKIKIEQDIENFDYAQC